MGLLIQTVAQTLTITYGDENDTSDGSGAQEITIFGLDGDYNQVTEVVATNGSSNVTAGAFIAVNRVLVTAAGVSGVNAGTISLAQSTSGLVVAHIEIGYAVTQQLIYTVPKGFVAYIIYAQTSTVTPTGGAANVDYFGKIYNPDTGVTFIAYRDKLDSDVGNVNIIDNPAPDPFSAGFVVTISANSNKSNTFSSGRISILLEVA